jgi:hypothetical protein
LLSNVLLLSSVGAFVLCFDILAVQNRKAVLLFSGNGRASNVLACRLIYNRTKNELQASTSSKRSN